MRQRLVRTLRSQQCALLASAADHQALDRFYVQLVESIDQGQIQKLDAYQLFTDLFEDCPES